MSYEQECLVGYLISSPMTMCDCSLFVHFLLTLSGLGDVLV